MLAAAMAPVASVALCAILVALPPLFGSVLTVTFLRIEPAFLPPFPTFAPLPSRAPPAA
jgi:hypothetical protein